MHSHSQRWVEKVELSAPGRVALFEFLAGLVEAWHFPTTLVAGHFPLLYSKDRNELVAVVDRELTARQSRIPGCKDLINGVGTNPTFSFDLSLKLLKRFADRNWRVAIAIDDHLFQRLQPEAPTGELAHSSRRSFYERHGGLPLSFEKLIEKHEFDMEDVLARNHAPERHRDSVLPKDASVYSETVHRNRFTNNRRKKLLQMPGFSEASTFYEQGLLYFTPLGSAERICLVSSDGKPYCSGAMIEFLFDLESQGAEGVLMFIPEFCREDVEIALEVFLSLESRLSTIACVWQTAGLDDQPVATSLFEASAP